MIISSSEMINGRAFIIDVPIDATNGYWCEKCECYHPYKYYSNIWNTSEEIA